MSKCARCGSPRLRRHHHALSALVKRLSTLRYYRCSACGWDGWRRESPGGEHRRPRPLLGESSAPCLTAAAVDLGDADALSRAVQALDLDRAEPEAAAPVQPEDRQLSQRRASSRRRTVTAGLRHVRRVRATPSRAAWIAIGVVVVVWLLARSCFSFHEIPIPTNYPPL